MSFLDNLENNLKSLESRDEEQGRREQDERAAARARALAAAPWAERLKKSSFTEDLLRHATRIGFAQRTKVRPAWIGTTLRLDAGSRRLEVEPGPEGIHASFYEGQQKTHTRPVDLDGSAEELAREWLA